MSKRANGEGSIYRRTDGRWCASITLDHGRRAHFLGRTRAEVSRKLSAAIEARENGAIVNPPRQLVRKFMSDWLTAVEPSLRPRTVTRYGELVRLHIVPEIGSLTLTRLSPQRLQKLYATKLETLSPTTVNHVHAVLHKALGTAVRWGLVNRNVADLVDAPRIAHFEIATLSAEQARTLIDAAHGDRLEALYVLAITTGLRQGELLALRWADVDVAGASLSVRGSMQATASGLRIVEPKTRTSQRQVTLSRDPVDALRRHRAAQVEERLQLGAAWEDNDLVFANVVGRPIAAGNLLRRSFEPLLRRAGLPRIRFHDLRHTLLLGRGIHPKIVAEMLGHSRVGTTLDRYSHVTPTMQRAAADAFDAILAR